MLDLYYIIINNYLNLLISYYNILYYFMHKIINDWIWIEFELNFEDVGFGFVIVWC